MSKIAHCKRYGCTAEGNAALDGCCSVEHRDVFDMTVERDEAIAERDAALGAITELIEAQAVYNAEHGADAAWARVVHAWLAVIPLCPETEGRARCEEWLRGDLELVEGIIAPPRATVEGEDA